MLEKLPGIEVIITTYAQCVNDRSAYSYLIRSDQGREALESRIIRNCDHPGKAELIAILTALRSLPLPSLVLLFPYHSSYLSQEFSNLENGIRHIHKSNEADIFDELGRLLKYHDVLIEYSKEIRPEAELLKDATAAVLDEGALIKLKS
jgi:hypothetical protein